MNDGLPLHFLLLLKERTNGFFSGYDKTTESVKQKFERTDYMIYCTTQNALSTNFVFWSRRSRKRKIDIPVKSFKRND